MRHSTSHLDSISDALNEAGHIALSDSGPVANAELAVLVGAHAVHLSSARGASGPLRDKCGVVFSAGNLPHYDAEGAHLRQGLKALLQTHP